MYRRSNACNFDPYAYFDGMSPFGRQILSKIISEYEQGGGSVNPRSNVLTTQDNRKNICSSTSMGPLAQTVPSRNHCNGKKANQNYSNENDNNFVSLLASQVDFFNDTQDVQQTSTSKTNQERNKSKNQIFDDIDKNFDEFDISDNDYVMHNDFNINKPMIQKGIKTNYTETPKFVVNNVRYDKDKGFEDNNLEWLNVEEIMKECESSSRNLKNFEHVESENSLIPDCDSLRKDNYKTHKEVEKVVETNVAVKNKVIDKLSKFAAPKKTKDTTTMNDPAKQCVIMLDSLQVDQSPNEKTNINWCEDFMTADQYLNYKDDNDEDLKIKEMENKSANYFPSQEVLSQKVWHLNKKQNPSKTKENIDKESKKANKNNELQNLESKAKNVKPLYTIEIDGNKKGLKKKLNQLKLSDMLPAKKKKTVAKQKPKLKNTRANKNVYQWLGNINEFIDTEVDDDLGLIDSDIEKLVDIELKAIEELDATEEANKFDVTNKLPNSNCYNNSTIQTVLAANTNGKMGFKKVESPPNIKAIDGNPDVKINNEQSASKARRKPKFIPPTQRSINRIEVNYDIVDLTEDDILNIKKNLSSDGTEIGFTIVFREGFCQMSKVAGTVDKICCPFGIIFYVSIPYEETKYFHFKINGLSSKEKELLKSFINDIMKSDVRKVCYEAQELIMLLFDLLHYNREDICLKWDIIDPKIGCFLLDPDNPPTSFPNILSQLSLDKDFEITNTCPKQKAAYLLNLLSECCKRLYETLTENNLWKVFISMETRLITILSAMELRGLCVDSTVLSNMETILNNKLKDIEKRAYVAAGKPFQLNSPTQLRKILFEELQLDVKHNITIKETLKLGAKSTSESVLRSLVSLHPLPGLILNHRNIHKAKTTFVNPILQQTKNGVIRTTWEQTSAATGRIVSCNPNLQAFPKQPLVLELFPEQGSQSQTVSLRNAFIARPGYTFVAADFQHIECRVFAHLTQDNVLIENFKQDIDIFTALAMKWMNKQSADEILPEDRDKTKHLVYALMYGAGAQKLSEILGMEVSQTSNIIFKFLASFPSLRTFKEKILNHCREDNGILRSIYGRVRRFQNINSIDQMQRAYCERQAINFVIQGSAADICKLAMIATEHRLSNLPEPLGHHLLLQIHDELVWEVPDENVNTFIDVVQEVMQHSGEFCGKLSVPLPVTIVKGKSWGQMF